MLFQLFKTRSPYWLIFIGIFGLGVWFIRIFPELQEINPSENMPLYQLLCFLLFKNKFAIAIIVYIVFIFTAYGLIKLNRQYFFLPFTYLHALLFVLLASPFTDVLNFPVYIAAFLLLISIYNLFGIYKSENYLSKTFNAGFFIGIASLFCLNTAFILPLIFVGIVFINPSGYRKYIIGMIGFILPWIFAWSYYFLTSQPSELTHLVQHNFLTFEKTQYASIIKLIYPGFILLMALLVSVWQIVRKDEEPIIVHKYFNLFLSFLIISIALLAVQNNNCTLLPVIMLPLAPIITRDLIRTRSSFVKNFLLFLIISICVSSIFFM